MSNKITKADLILADTEFIMAALAKAEKESSALQEKRDFYSELLIEAQNSDKITESAFTKDNTLVSSENSTCYSMKMVFFVNARHFVTFGDNSGPVHAHSWRLEFQIMIPRGKNDVVEFSMVSEALTKAIQPFQNIILNNIYPFNQVQPTTENIAMYCFNLAQDTLLELDLDLNVLTLWETPTRGIHVNSRNPQFDSLSPIANTVNDTVNDAETSATDIAVSPPSLESANKNEEKTIPEQKTQASIHPVYSYKQYGIAVAVLFIIALLAYHQILWPPVGQGYPWGSDTWGHLFKAEYLYHQIMQGNYYPQFTEYWYNGTQPFRYWAPLPYYILAFFRAGCGDIFTAANLFIFTCALFGGLSFLLLAPRMRLWPAVMAGTVWMVWLDNVRVAFSEGNLPRVLATALLPLLFILFLNIIEKEKLSKNIIIIIILVQLIILSHAMIAAIYCLCLTLFTFFLWAFGGCRLKTAVLAIAVLLLGIVSSAWWLLPSLTGGITEINTEAVKEIVQFVSAGVSFNPFHRFTDRETFYWGISLIAAIAVTFYTWKSKPIWARSLAVSGIILILITFPLMRELYITLPLSHLLWPLRFSSFAAMAVISSCLCFNLPEQRQKWLKANLKTSAVIAAIFIMLLTDCWFSLPLLSHTGKASFNLIQSAEFIKKTPGWRIATIDLSQLGSAPSYVFSELFGMEQVFGWAWQGAITSNNIMLLNTGLDSNYYPFLFRSCVDLGATDLVVKDDVIDDIQEFRRAAEQAGYKQENSFGEISIWHSGDHPYLVVKEPECLLIGKYAGTIALQFPEVEMGIHSEIDSYSSEYLQRYKKLILSGASWHSKSNAEQIIKDYVSAGGQVFVELAGMPENVLAKQPEFLGVYGETVSLQNNIEIFGANSRYSLIPFSPDIELWKAYVPMGLDKVELEFSYYGKQAAVYGYKLLNNQKIYFLGGNLFFHTLKTGDTMAMKLLKDTLGLSTSYTQEQLLPLQSYQVNESGYKMVYHSDHALDAAVPVAAIDGMKVKIDGKPCPKEIFENLLKIRLPAGTHEIEILLELTSVYHWGLGISALSGLFLFLGIFYYKFKSPMKLSTHKQNEEIL